MSTPPPDLTETGWPSLATSERSARRMVEGGAGIGRRMLTVLLAEYDRRGTAERELESRLDGQAWADLEAERDRLSEGLRSMARRASDMRRVAAMVMDYAAARSTPGAPAPAERLADPTPACGCGGYTAGTIHVHACSCTPTMQDRGYRCDGCIADADDFAAAASPGADTPAEPTGTAALLARCDALDRLPAPEGASGRSVSVEEIRRLLREHPAAPTVFACDQSPHPPAQCPRCEPIGETT